MCSDLPFSILREVQRKGAFLTMTLAPADAVNGLLGWKPTEEAGEVGKCPCMHLCPYRWEHREERGIIEGTISYRLIRRQHELRPDRTVDLVVLISQPSLSEASLPKTVDPALKVLAILYYFH